MRASSHQNPYRYNALENEYLTSYDVATAGLATGSHTSLWRLVSLKGESWGRGQGDGVVQRAESARKGTTPKLHDQLQLFGALCRRPSMPCVTLTPLLTPFVTPLRQRSHGPRKALLCKPDSCCRPQS
jgi:hypothetical protein